MMNLHRVLKWEREHQVNRMRLNECVLQQLFWECTLRCNLNCRHCGSDCRIESLKPDMPLTDFLPVLDEVAEHFNSHEIMVITSGGEPLMRPDLADCGKAITDRGFYWGMVTNGMLLTEDKLDELIDVGLNSITVSLDGLEPEHNWMRGNSHSFDKAVAAIQYIANRSNYLSWDVVTCVNQHNFSSLAKLRDFLEDLGGHYWRLATIFPSGRAAHDPELQLDGKQIRALMDFIKNTRNDTPIEASFGCEGFLGEYENEVRDYQFFCQAGINVASVLYDGAISGCLSIRAKYNEGNIYQDSFIDVWNKRFQRYRNRSWMKTGDCKTCRMWRWCEGNGFHLRDDDGALLTCLYKRMSQICN